MNKVLLSLVVGSFLLTGSVFAQAPAAPAAAEVSPAAGAPEAAVKTPKHHEAKHSDLHKVLRKLKGAKEDLQKTTKEFGGHKLKALEAINQAIEEVKAALESEKK